METKLLAASPESIALGAELLRKGELVAFPTETVYGLGANAFDSEAVRNIFAAKGRPADNPLIVHVWSRDQLAGICEVPPLAEKLMDAFWPGPLTLLMPRKPQIPLVVTASLPTVAVRMPSHPVAAALLKACNVPVAAPSANRSGKPSPTAAKHVMEDMEGRIPLILDGGNCEVGVESTVLDISGEVPCILRPGGITKGMLEQVLPRVDVAGSVLRPLQPGEKALSPGMRYKHYAPAGVVTLVEGEERQVVAACRALYKQAEAEGKRAWCAVLYRACAGAGGLPRGSSWQQGASRGGGAPAVRASAGHGRDGHGGHFQRGAAARGRGSGGHEPAGTGRGLPQRTGGAGAGGLMQEKFCRSCTFFPEKARIRLDFSRKVL